MSATHPYPYPGARQAGLSSTDYGCTLEEIARTMGISRERVRQLESLALAKAYRILTERGFPIADFLECVPHG